MQKIMIIEDEPSVREELASLLRDEGYQPFTVADFKNIKEHPFSGTETRKEAVEEQT